MSMSTDSDNQFMQRAISLSLRGLGNTAPNPNVGCIIVAPDGNIVGRGWTSPTGRPHAETNALEQAGTNAKGATAYITLEPCSHYGKTPPCAESLINAGISRAVIGTKDPSPHVNGQGINLLKQAGIDITLGVCENDARQAMAGFFKVLEYQRPYTTLKLATSADGYIAWPDGNSKWITGERAREFSHLLRAQNDAMLIGVGTVLADNPSLTCRLPDLEKQSPIRIIADSRLRTPPSSNIITSASQETPTWILHDENHANSHKITKSNVTLLPQPIDQSNHLDIKKALTTLAQRGITRLLSEGGSHLAASLIKNNLVDELIWIKAPIIIGEGGLPAIYDQEIATLLNKGKWKKGEQFMLDKDTITHFFYKDSN